MIDKSKTKLKPKAAPSRRAPASSHTSARTSVDRQAPSQTPQPQPTQHAAPTSSVSTELVGNSTPVVSDTNASAVGAAAQSSESVSQNAEVDLVEDSVRGPQRAPQKRPRDSGAVSIPLPGASAPDNTGRLSVPTIISPSRPVTPASQVQHDLQAKQQTRVTQTTVLPSESPRTDEPANKRRRLEPLHEQSSPIGAVDTSHDEALPTTETITADESTLHNDAATPPPSQVFSQPIRQSVESTPIASQARKPKQSAKARGKQRAAESLVGDDVAPGSRQAKGARRKTKSGKDKDAGTAAQTVDGPEAGSTDEEGTGQPKRRKKREVTPENAEDIRVDPAEMRMSELTKNLRIGKKSTRGTKLQEMDEEAKAERKQRRVDQRNGVEEQPTAEEIPAETAEERLARLAPPKPAENVRDAIEYDIEGDRIVINEESLQVDRAAKGAAERGDVQFEGVEENDLTRRINQASWGKRDKSGGWGETLTEQFYDGLRMFGTDFNMISKMFPGRTRRSVKLKFNKEEKQDPVRIERALKGERVPIDMDEYQKASMTTYGDPAELERKMAEDRKTIEADVAATKAALDEAAQQRVDEAAAEAEAADREAAENDSSAKENRAGRKRGEASGRSRKKKRSSRKMEPTSKEPSARQRNLKHNKDAKAKATKIRVTKATDDLLRGTILDD